MSLCTFIQALRECKQAASLCLLLIALPGLGADRPAADAEALARAGIAAASGFGALQARLSMHIGDASGRGLDREMRLFLRELAPAGAAVADVPAERLRQHSLIVFDAPADQRGTALLTRGNLERDDDQWLHLPALGRVSRIVARNRSGSFVGSEFSFEDLMPWRLEDWAYVLLEDAPCGERSCNRLERRPQGRRSGYSRQELWLDTVDHLIRRIDYFDRKGAHQKTLTVDGYRYFPDRCWRPSRMAMRNHETGRFTRIAFADYRFGGRALDEALYDPRQLDAVR